MKEEAVSPFSLSCVLFIFTVRYFGLLQTSSRFQCGGHSLHITQTAERKKTSSFSRWIARKFDMLQTVKCRMIAASVFATLRNSRIPLRWRVTVKHVKPWNWKALYLVVPLSLCVCDRHAFMFASLSVWVCTCVHGCLCICMHWCVQAYVCGWVGLVCPSLWSVFGTKSTRGSYGASDKTTKTKLTSRVTDYYFCGEDGHYDMINSETVKIWCNTHDAMLWRYNHLCN